MERWFQFGHSGMFLAGIETEFGLDPRLKHSGVTDSGKYRSLRSTSVESFRDARKFLQFRLPRAVSGLEKGAQSALYENLRVLRDLRGANGLSGLGKSIFIFCLGRALCGRSDTALSAGASP